MKILILAAGAGSHTYKWAKSLSEQGCEIFLFSLMKLDKDLYRNVRLAGYKELDLYSSGEDNPGHFSKVSYLKAVPVIKKIIREFKPDLLHAHYASSYGLIGALTRFHPYIISVWGSDIYTIPKQSFFHKALVKFALNRADVILSTSDAMKKETLKYINKKIDVTPFGIDVVHFKPAANKSPLFSEQDLVIGTIKSLEKNYAIDSLIKAFKILKDKHSRLPLKLLIVGSGSLENELKQLCNDLKITDAVVFTGMIPFKDVVNYYNMLDVYVALSLSESFGVAVLEASSCEIPVVVSNVGGLPEVVRDGITGLVVPANDESAAASAIEKLIIDRTLAKKMGEAGREWVKSKYEWDASVKNMIQIYKNINVD